MPTFDQLTLARPFLPAKKYCGRWWDAVKHIFSGMIQPQMNTDETQI
jgi:hypothetical protein